MLVKTDEFYIKMELIFRPVRINMKGVVHVANHLALEIKLFGNVSIPSNNEKGAFLNINVLRINSTTSINPVFKCKA